MRSNNGVIELSTVRASYSDVGIMLFITSGKLTRHSGEEIGQCQFDLYRRKRNRSWMDFEDIYYWMDVISGSGQRMAQALGEDGWIEAEYNFNTSALLVAERIHIEPSARGQGAWKSLYFATMEKALKPLRRTPEEFFFKAFPLEFEGNVTKENEREFKAAERGLKLSYQVHLGAKALEVPADLGCYMRAPVPEYLQR